MKCECLCPWCGKTVKHEKDTSSNKGKRPVIHNSKQTSVCKGCKKESGWLVQGFCSDKCYDAHMERLKTSKKGTHQAELDGSEACFGNEVQD